MFVKGKYKPDHYEEREGKRVALFWFKCRSNRDTGRGIQVLALDAHEAAAKALPSLLSARDAGDVIAVRLDGGRTRRTMPVRK